MLYQLTDLPEVEAKHQLEKIGLSPSILEELFPSSLTLRSKNTLKKCLKHWIYHLIFLKDVLMNYQGSKGQSSHCTGSGITTRHPNTGRTIRRSGPHNTQNSFKFTQKDKQKFNTTILMVSHHVDFIEEVTTRAIMMENGNLVMDGNPHKLCNTFVERCHADYLKDFNELKTDGWCLNEI